MISTACPAVSKKPSFLIHLADAAHLPMASRGCASRDVEEAQGPFKECSERAVLKSMFLVPEAFEL